MTDNGGHLVGTQLEDLLELNLDHNRITAIPPEIKKFDVLERLRLEDNQLSTLPEILEIA